MQPLEKDDLQGGNESIPSSAFSISLFGPRLFLILPVRCCTICHASIRSYRDISDNCKGKVDVRQHEHSVPYLTDVLLSRKPLENKVAGCQVLPEEAK